MSDKVQPIFILPEGTSRTSGKNAQRMNIMAAKAVAETVRSTLGPKGMDKMLVDSLGDVVVTNDGATILKEIEIEHPAGKMVVEVSKTQEEEAGDGTTTAVVIAGELLKRAEDLMEQNVHQSIITKGFTIAAEEAQKILNELGQKITTEDTENLEKIVITAMTGKNVESSKEKLAKLLVKAVQQIVDRNNNRILINTDNIKIEKKTGGSMEETELIDGIVVDKERAHPNMPDIVKKANVLLLESALEVKETESDTKINISSPEQLRAFMDEEEKTLRDMVKKIKELKATVVFCQKGIDDVVQHLLAKEGILAVRRVKRSDIEKLSRATGGQIVTKLEDAVKEDIGYAGLVEELKVGDEQMTFVRECKNPKAVTLLLRGGTEHVIDELERSIDDALGDLRAVIEDQKVVAGGGAPEIEVSRLIRKYSETISGREQLAIKAFADALEIIPRTLAENAGMDPIDILIKLKAKHEEGMRWAGVNVFDNKVSDMWELGVIEPLRVKKQAMKSSAEVATTILRIDDVIAAGKLKNKDAGMPRGMGGMPDMEGMM
ncbi:MAG: thermosome subunit alpha [Candidatus Nanoarchaeia archaeon]|nr:thermosome subunit alpha [Candidatus Nanoarchaeia archaeon]